MSRENSEGGQMPNWKASKEERVFGTGDKGGRRDAKANESINNSKNKEEIRGEGVVKIRKFLAELFKKTEKVNFSELENYLEWVTKAYDNYLVYRRCEAGKIELSSDEKDEFVLQILTGGDQDFIEIKTSLGGGAGGQNVQKNMSRIQMFHLPTGMISTSHQERSPEQNKKKSRERLFDMVTKHLDFLKKSTRDGESLSVTLQRLCNESFGDEYRKLGNKEMDVFDLLWEDKFGSEPKVLKTEKKNPPQI